MAADATKSSLLRDDRMGSFSYPFRITFFTGFGLIGLYAVINLGITVWSVVFYTNTLQAIGFSARLVQISLGMMMGFFTIFLGMLAAWMGIEGRYKMTGHSEGYGVTFASASPGILLIVCGTFLVNVCLSKEMEFSQEELVKVDPVVTPAGVGKGAPSAPQSSINEESSTESKPLKNAKG